jgi:flagellar export protein FliJ
MKRFRFKFEAVERVRRIREEEALRALAQAQRQYQLALDHKANLQNELENALIRRESLGQQAVSVIAFHTEQDFINGTKQRIIQAEHMISRAARQVEKMLRTYLHTRKQLKTIEMLREKAFSEYKAERQKYEQKQLDDLNIMRARFGGEEQVA